MGLGMLLGRISMLLGTLASSELWHHKQRQQSLLAPHEQDDGHSCLALAHQQGTAADARHRWYKQAAPPSSTRLQPASSCSMLLWDPAKPITMSANTYQAPPPGSAGSSTPWMWPCTRRRSACCRPSCSSSAWRGCCRSCPSWRPRTGPTSTGCPCTRPAPCRVCLSSLGDDGGAVPGSVGVPHLEACPCTRPAPCKA